MSVAKIQKYGIIYLMTTTFEALDSADEPRPSRLFHSPWAGRLVCRDTVPTDWAGDTAAPSPESLAQGDWEEVSRRTDSETTEPVRFGDVLGTLALFADLDLSNLDRPDMTDAAIAAPRSVAPVGELLSRIDAVMAEASDAWTLGPGVAHMRFSETPDDEINNF
jgi:hypothetical protein